MTMDDLTKEIERLERGGAIVLLKWDGEREASKRTVVILRNDSGYQFRRDTDHLEEALAAGVRDYDAHHK